MNKSYWTLPVDIRLAGIPRIRTIATSGFAIECLTTMWPTGSHGPSFYCAILACFDAIDGRASHGLARHAFMKAAQDADICDGNSGTPNILKPLGTPAASQSELVKL